MKIIMVDQKIQNPFTDMSTGIQKVHWKYLQKCVLYRIEIIAPYLCDNIIKTNKTVYITYLAKVWKDAIIYKNVYMYKYDIILFEIIASTLHKGLEILPMRIKKDFSKKALGNDNLQIEFMKDDRGKMKILLAGVNKISEEQKEYVREYYEISPDQMGNPSDRTETDNSSG